MNEAQSGNQTVTIFGSGTAREGSSACAEAARLGTALAQRGFTVCNGGYGGPC